MITMIESLHVSENVPRDTTFTPSHPLPLNCCSLTVSPNIYLCVNELHSIITHKIFINPINVFILKSFTEFNRPSKTTKGGKNQLKGYSDEL